MRGRGAVRFAVTSAILGLVVAACGSGGPERPAALGAATTSAPNPATLLPGAAPSTPSSPLTPGVVRTTPPSGGGPGESPAPISFPWESRVPVQANVTPSCVVRGGSATINVRTVSKASVIYHAVYAGTKGGAPPPYGHGYGGSDGGPAGADGRYTDSWDVRVDAPVGPARVDVVVGNGEDFGYDDPPFFVAASRSGCP